MLNLCFPKHQLLLNTFKESILTTNTGTINATAFSEPRGISEAQKLVLIAGVFGAVMGVIFIMMQPLFGMDTLTSRHAAAYQQLGGLSAAPAIAIAWIAHSAVSIFYGLISGLVMVKFSRVGVIALFALLFTWFTTVIAPPANAMIVQLVSFQQLKIDQLPALNFALDVKFLLHLVFFAAISIALYIYKNKSAQS